MFEFLPIEVSPIYERWLILEFILIFAFLVSTKFPILELFFKIVPGRNLAYGPTTTFFSIFESSIWVNDLIY